MKNKLSFVNKTRALVFVTVVSVLSLAGYVGYDQVGVYQNQLRNEGLNVALTLIQRNIAQNCQQDINFTSIEETLTLTTEECVSADYYDVVTEKGELILRSDTGVNLLLVPVE